MPVGPNAGTTPNDPPTTIPQSAVDALVAPLPTRAPRSARMAQLLRRLLRR